MKKALSIALVIAIILSIIQNNVFWEPSFSLAETMENIDRATPSEVKETVGSKEDEIEMDIEDDMPIATDSNASRYKDDDVPVATDSNAHLATDSNAHLATDSNAKNSYTYDFNKIVNGMSVLTYDSCEEINKENPLMFGEKAIFRFSYKCKSYMKRALSDGNDITLEFQLPNELLELTEEVENTELTDNPISDTLSYVGSMTNDGYVDINILSENYDEDTEDFYIDLPLKVNSNYLQGKTECEIKFKNAQDKLIKYDLYLAENPDIINYSIPIRPNYVPDEAIYDETTGHYYMFYNEHCTWDEAKAYCEGFNGHLVTITSKAEKDFVGQLLTERYGNGNATGGAWIGFYYSDGFKWVTGEPFEYTNWNPGEPNYNEPHGLANRNQLWNDADKGRFPFICEWEDQDITHEQPDYIPEDAIYNENNGHWYKLYEETTSLPTWTSVKKECERLGGYLITITSADEQNFMKKISNGKGHIWLGATDEKEEGHWEWVTGEKFGEYTNWTPGEPNNEENREHYMVARGRDNYTWDDRFDKPTNGPYAFICEWEDEIREGDSIEIGRTDNQILIDKVRQYTTGDMEDLFIKIMNSTISVEEKSKLLHELFVYFGILDPNEGVDLLINSKPERYAYNVLTNDDIFIAYQYKSFLNGGTAEGNAARILLFADGLIFNNELKDYVSVDTATGQLPGVKKYKALLLEFMEASTKDIEITEYADKISSFMKKCSKVMGVIEEEEYHAIEKSLKKAGSKEEIDSIFRQWKTRVVLDDGTKITYEFEDTMFSKALGYSSDVIKVIDFSVNDIKAFFDVQAKIDTYAKYKDFLSEIQNSEDLPWEMRTAAGSLIIEFESNYLTPFRNLLNDVFEFSSGKLNLLDTVKFGEVNIELSKYLETLELATWVSNQIVDMGTLTKKSQYVEGYGFLTEHFNNKLKKTTKIFQFNPNIENARDFYNNYVLLYNLRLHGEKAYADMCDINGIAYLAYKIFNGHSYYQANIDVALSNIELLEKTCKFELDDKLMDSSNVKYQKKIIISCPVRVTVLDSNGNIIAELDDGKPSDNENEYGRFIVKYVDYSQDYSKIIYLNNTNVNIKIEGETVGYVSCTISEPGYVSYQLDNYAIDSDTVIKFSADKPENCTVEKESGISDIRLQKIMRDNIVVATDMSVPQIIEMRLGEKVTPNVKVLPENTTFKDLKWWTDDDSLLAVHNGVISSLAEGIGTVKVTEVTSGITKKIKVVVNSESYGNDIVDNTGEIKNNSSGEGSLYEKKFHTLCPIPIINTIQPNITSGAWVQESNNWKLLKEDGTYAKGQWALLDGRWYIFNEDGYMIKDMCKVNGIQYFFNADGTMATGWVQIENVWYYFDINSGAMKTGWIKVDDKWYYLKADGTLIVNSITPDGYKVNEKGRWIQ